MIKTLFASFIMLAPLMFAQAALASDTQATATQATQSSSAQGVSNSDILAMTQDYQHAQDDCHQPRRSALFAQILDAAAQRSTLAAAKSAPSGV